MLPSVFPFDPLAFGLDIARQYGDIAYYKAGPLHVYQLAHPDLARQILVSVGARAVAIKMGQQRRLLASADLPAAIDRDIDMRTLTVWSAMVESFQTMLETGNQTIRIVGPAPGGAQFIEVVVDEKPLRLAMYRFSRNLLLVSLGIAMLAGALVLVRWRRTSRR